VVFVWAVPDGTLAKTLAFDDQNDTRHNPNQGAGSVMSLAINPDGSLVGLARHGSIPVILRWRTGQLAYLEGHQGNSHGLAFSPNGKTLVSGTHMKPFVRLYDATSGKELGSFDLEGGEPTFTCVRFSADGKQIAVGLSDGSVRLLASDLSKQIRSIKVSDDTEKVQALAYATKADLLAAATTTKVRLFEATSGKQLREWGKADLRASTVALSPDGKLLAVGYGGKHNAKGELRGGYVNIWDTATGRLAKKLD
jgi:WD40 repeat protein